MQHLRHGPCSIEYQNTMRRLPFNQESLDRLESYLICLLNLINVHNARSINELERCWREI